VSFLSDLAADNQRADAPRFFVLSLVLSVFSPLSLSALKTDIFPTFFRCLFVAFALILSRFSRPKC
jgi:hypothetical protein